MPYSSLEAIITATNKDKVAVVVLSGGQDSVTCLGLALQHYAKVYAVGFTYGQKHNVELLCARRICEQYNVEYNVYSIPALAELKDSALISGSSEDLNASHHAHPNLPSSFVPNRNALFLTTAHAFAQKVNADHIITGVCETDYSGYPDCRQVFITALESALNIGYETNIRILTPLMNIDKAETFKLAEDVDFLDVVLKDSHTCYFGAHDAHHFNEWGYGCGQCPACKLRAKGWGEFLNGKND